MSDVTSTPGRFLHGKTNYGWAVLRKADAGPWHLAGMFPSEAAAEEVRAQLGEAYETAYGANREGSDDFIRENPPAQA